jgi:hypothetical protein
MSFWEEQRRGTNLFNRLERRERLAAAKAFGAQFVRIAPSKWLNGRSTNQVGDFLIGPANERFSRIVKKDVARLKQVLDDANAVGLKVVLTMLSLPGNRWQQHNQGIAEREIWRDFAQQELAISFWRQLAEALAGHPAIVGYNLRNEPAPELVEPKLTDWYSGDYEAWYEDVKGTPADLNLFYRKAVDAIRQVDAETPIVLESGFYATAWGLKVLEPVADENVLYSFHMYEPYSYTSHHNRDRYKYPGQVPIGEAGQAILEWNKAQLEEYLNPVSVWQAKHNIASDRIVVSEFGVYRTNPGAEAYLADLIETLDAHGWHWAFYAFREDTWPGMDYELGTQKPGEKYWDAIENNRIPGAEVYQPNSLSSLLRAAMQGHR